MEIKWGSLLNEQFFNSKFTLVLIFILFILLGPIIVYFLFFILKIILKLVYYIYLFYWRFFFSKEKNDDYNKDTPTFNSNNQYPYRFQDKDLTLIELKMLELNQKEQQQKQYDLFKIELEQNKTQTKIDLNQQKYYFENKLLEQKINNLEKELQRIIGQQNNSLTIKENEVIKKEREIKNDFINVNLGIIEKAVKNQIPMELKQIFEKLTNIENIQLFILKNIIEQKSYYDQEKHILYIHPNDLIFIKILFNEHKKLEISK